MFLLSAVALIMAVRGYFSVAEEHGGGNTLSYVFEVGLPALLFVGLVWEGVMLWRKAAPAV